MSNGAPAAAPPPTPASVRPTVGLSTSFAAPKPLQPVTLKTPVIDSKVKSATVDVSLGRKPPAARVNAPLIDDEEFTFGLEPSAQHADAAIKVCFMLGFNGPFIQVDGLWWSERFVQCVQVVHAILQRAEELRKRHQTPPKVKPAQARRCYVAAIPLKGQRGRAPLKISCKRVGARLQVTIRPSRPGRSLRSALGANAKIVVGRSRAAPVRPDDRVNVLWTTSNR